MGVARRLSRSDAHHAIGPKSVQPDTEQESCRSVLLLSGRVLLRLVALLPRVVVLVMISILLLR